MKTTNWIRLAAICCAASAPLSGQPIPASSIGGQVQNSTSGNYLNTARITIEGTTLTTLTTEFGQYFIPGVPAGEARVTVFYSGLPPQTKSINVATGQRAVQDFDLTTYMDVDVSYQIHPKLSLFASATNVTGKPRSSYVYTEKTPDYARRRQTNYYGAAIVVGAKGQF